MGSMDQHYLQLDNLSQLQLILQQLMYLSTFVRIVLPFFNITKFCILNNLHLIQIILNLNLLRYFNFHLKVNAYGLHLKMSKLK